jgi:hypothetical protein
MTHNFVKQKDGSKVCTHCGDEKGVDDLRICSYSILVQHGENEKKFKGGGAINGGVNTSVTNEIPRAETFRQLMNIPPPKCTLLSFRIVNPPQQIIRKFATDIVKLNNSNAAGLLFRGFVQRLEEGFVEVVLVTLANTLEATLVSILVDLLWRWKVDLNELRFEQENTEFAHFLYESKFHVIQDKTHPQNVYNFYDEADDNYTVVSSLR